MSRNALKHTGIPQYDPLLIIRWHTQHVKDGDHDVDAIEAAIEAAKAVKDKPSMIKLTTTIGFGSKLQGTGGVHGNPLKPDDAKNVKKLL
jgi:transketolase